MIPEVTDIEKPFLRLLNAKVISTKALIALLKSEFKLSKESLECLTACGRQKKFDNRVIYVRTKLIREGKIEMDKKKNIWRNNTLNLIK